MGCSVSKELQVKNPSKDTKALKDTKEAWEAVLPKGLALQLDTRIQTMNTGYIAAIFSANLRHSGPVEAFDRNDLFLSHQLQCHEDYPKKKTNKSVQRAMKKGWPDPTLFQPLLNSGRAKETSTGRNLKEGAKAELETIDMWELMKDLEEEDFSNKDVKDDCQLITNKMSHDNMRQLAATISRSQSLGSFRCADDVGTSIAAHPSKVSVMEESALFISLHDVEEAKELSAPRSHKLLDMACEGDIMPEYGSSWLVCRRTCENSFDRGLWTMREESGWTDHNLQRALSMKYILSDDAGEEEDLDFLDENHALSNQLSKMNLTEFNEDNLDIPMGSEGSSYSSSPEFSATASLKDWLPSDTPPFAISDSLHDGFDASVVLGGTHMLLEQHMNPYLLPKTRRVLLKYVGGSTDFSLESAREKGLLSQPEAHMEDWNTRIQHGAQGHF